MQEMQVWYLGQEDLEKEMTTHSSILVWETPGTKEADRLQSMGLKRVRHNLGTTKLLTTTTELKWHSSVDQKISLSFPETLRKINCIAFSGS